MPAWYDPVLQVPSDSKRRARYRALQSWYRETVLGVEPGRHSSGRLVGSLLPKQPALDKLNFLDEQVASYAERRAEQVLKDGGTLDRDRLRRNLLSSMPLCFNLFGKLGAEQPAAARVLGAVLGLEIATVDQVLVEHAPPAAKAMLEDRTAFDAFVAYTTPTGAKGFVGVETKYTEPFSPGRTALTTTSGFRPTGRPGSARRPPGGWEGRPPTSYGATRCWRRPPARPTTTTRGMRWWSPVGTTLWHGGRSRRCGPSSTTRMECYGRCRWSGWSSSAAWNLRWPGGPPSSGGATWTCPRSLAISRCRPRPRTSRLFPWAPSSAPGRRAGTARGTSTDPSSMASRKWLAGPYRDGWSRSGTMAATTSSTSSAACEWTRPPSRPPSTHGMGSRPSSRQRRPIADPEWSGIDRWMPGFVKGL